ncbi:MAG: LptA/OstA family protein [Candidatus Caldatribacteriaceae bacterium]
MKKPLFLCFMILVLWSAFAFGEEENVLVVRTSQAEYDEKSGKIIARASTLTWRDLEIFCPSLEVDTKAQEVRTSGDIRVIWKDFEAHVGSLVYSRKTNILSISSLSGSGKDVAFSSQIGFFDFEKNLAHFEGNPRLSLRGFELGFGRVDYDFSQRVWKGEDATLIREGWRGKAKRALYTEGGNLFVLEGEAEINREGNLLRGERITVNLDILKVQVEGNVEIFLLPPKGEE